MAQSSRSTNIIPCCQGIHSYLTMVARHNFLCQGVSSYQLSALYGSVLSRSSNRGPNTHNMGLNTISKSKRFQGVVGAAALKILKIWCLRSGKNGFSIFKSVIVDNSQQLSMKKSLLNLINNRFLKKTSQAFLKWRIGKKGLTGTLDLTY